ncbi:hypothetical protein RHMOL_Rhmol03G0117600 [Rhododendron molle]|uniref:Uncharacterized protein n=1 Tax=Rhododendron molle TaxID=49168 RepID=A0ACC0PFS9_RHOML|nr:hypothetical protein RHMOL_Rhmol03G0117600 [Rhododendron molle]
MRFYGSKTRTPFFWGVYYRQIQKGNTIAINISENHDLHSSRTKHVDICHRFLHEQVAKETTVSNWNMFKQKNNWHTFLQRLFEKNNFSI